MTDPAPAEKPAGYPDDAIETITLSDGFSFLLRPILPDDAPRLQEGFRRLSPQSVYLRFLETFRELPENQARGLASVDYQGKMAFVAEIEEHGEPHLIGVARYATLGPLHPGLAESAIVVADEFQKRGIGTLMLARLVRYARQHGITAFLATMHQSNNQIMRFIRKSNLPFERKFLEPGVWEVNIKLTRDNLFDT